MDMQDGQDYGWGKGFRLLPLTVTVRAKAGYQLS